MIKSNNQIISESDIKRVKGLGCLKDKRYSDIFNIRVITVNGKITTEKARIIMDAADKFGSGEVTLTARQTIEVQGIPYSNIDNFIKYLNDNDIQTGGTGPKVRPIVSCKGTTCQYGLIDTFSLSEKIHDVFYTGYHDVVLPHKFKIGVGGCPNNCIKPELNDLGVIGQVVPTIKMDKCHLCKVCNVSTKCPMKAVKVNENNIDIDSNVCNNCGRCINMCPFNAVTKEVVGYKIYIGGRWGKKTAKGIALDKVFTSEEEVMNVIHKTINLFKDEGIAGERLSDTINRLGFDYIQNKLIGTIDEK